MSKPPRYPDPSQLLKSAHYSSLSSASDVGRLVVSSQQKGRPVQPAQPHPSPRQSGTTCVGCGQKIVLSDSSQRYSHDSRALRFDRFDSLLPSSSSTPRYPSSVPFLPRSMSSVLPPSNCRFPSIHATLLVDPASLCRSCRVPFC